MALDVVLAETAWHDLDEVYDWIAEKGDPDTAHTYVSRILSICGSLAEFA